VYDGGSNLHIQKRRQAVWDSSRRFVFYSDEKLFVVFRLQDFTTTVKAVWADVVTQMRFTRGWLNGSCRCGQEIV
jgi:hypothetical protein